MMTTSSIPACLPTVLTTGSVLVLGTAGPDCRCTVEGLAGVMVLELLAATEAHVHRLVATSSWMDDAGALRERQQHHEGRWMAAGELLDLIQQHHENGHVCDAVLYLDPWSTNVDGDVRRLWPMAKRVVLDSNDTYRHRDQELANADAYWTEIAKWIAALAIDHHLSARALLEHESVHAVHPLRCDAADLDLANLPARLIVIDEAASHPPDPDFVRQVLSRFPSSTCVLLTAHWATYRAHHPDLLDQVGLALGTDDLSPGVYSAILHRASQYLAPAGLPFGPVALRHVPVEAEVLVPDSDRDQIAAAMPHGKARLRSRSSWDSESSTSPSPSGSLPQPTQSTADLSGSFLGWWRKLASLQTTSLASPPRPTPSAVATKQIALLTCCYKYLQRFRVFIDSVVRQRLPLDQIEVCVVTPGNPDGVLEYIDLIRRVHPGLTLTVIPVPETPTINKGKLLNEAFRSSTAPVIMVADCDLVLPPEFLQTVLRDFRPDEVMGCWRTALSPDVTARILVGDLDPVAEYESLCRQWDEVEIAGGVRQGLLGYCQIVARSVFAEVGYPEDFDGFNQSDIVFIDRLREQARVSGNFRKDLFLLHLSHHRDWTGTKVYL